MAAAERLGGDRVGDEAGDVSCRGGMAAATGVGGDWVGREGVAVPGAVVEHERGPAQCVLGRM